MGKRAAMIADRCPRWQCGMRCGMRWQRQQPSIRCEGIGWQGSAEGVQQFCPFERRGEGVQSPKRRDANRINSLCWVRKVLLAWPRSPGLLLEDIEARDGPIPPSGSRAKRSTRCPWAAHHPRRGKLEYGEERRRRKAGLPTHSKWQEAEGRNKERGCV